MGIRIIIPGHGVEGRTSPLKHALSILRPHCTMCHVYMYAPTTFALHECVTIRRRGLWSDFMKIYDPGSDDDVLLMMDDVRPDQTFNLTAFYKLRRTHNVDALSATIPHWHHHIMRPIQHSTRHIRYLSYVDMLFVLFSNSAWRCWSKQINTSINHIGWGYDITFANLCKVRLGVSDMFIARHPRGKRTYSSREAVIQERKWITMNNITQKQASCIKKNDSACS